MCYRCQSIGDGGRSGGCRGGSCGFGGGGCRDGGGCGGGGCRGVGDVACEGGVWIFCTEKRALRS